MIRAQDPPPGMWLIQFVFPICGTAVHPGPEGKKRKFREKSWARIMQRLQAQESPQVFDDDRMDVLK